MLPLHQSPNWLTEAGLYIGCRADQLWSMADPLTPEWLPGRYAVCRLEPGVSPGRLSWLARALHLSMDETGGRLLSITRTEREVSVVIEESLLPTETEIDPSMPIQRGFVAMRIAGALDFSLVGVLSKLTSALAAANVSVFVLSTYDTDILLVREGDRERAAEALRDVAKPSTG